jgi:putative transposase
MIYAFIAPRGADMPVDAVCRAMRVSKSAYYAWRRAEANPTPRMLAEREFGDLIVKIHEQSFGTYGWRGTAELRLGLGRDINHKRVARMMRERGLHGVTRRRRSKGCTRSRAADLRSNDLVHRQFRPDGPDRLWCRTSPSTAPVRAGSTSPSSSTPGVVVSWAGRSPITCAPSSSPTRSTWPRGAGGRSREVIAHSDHGSNYCSWVFGQRLRNAGLLGSMGTVGDALDNAVAGSFFASLQCELLDRHELANPSRACSSDVPLDRELLQPDPPPLHPRLPRPRRRRDHRSGMIPHQPRPSPGVHSTTFRGGAMGSTWADEIANPQGDGAVGGRHGTRGLGLALRRARRTVGQKIDLSIVQRKVVKPNGFGDVETHAGWIGATVAPLGGWPRPGGTPT